MLVVTIAGEERKYTYTYDARAYTPKVALIDAITKLNPKLNKDYVRTNLTKVTSEEVGVYFQKGYLWASVINEEKSTTNYYVFSFKVDNLPKY